MILSTSWIDSHSKPRPSGMSLHLCIHCNPRAETRQGKTCHGPNHQLLPEIQYFLLVCCCRGWGWYVYVFLVATFPSILASSSFLLFPRFPLVYTPFRARLGLTLGSDAIRSWPKNDPKRLVRREMSRCHHCSRPAGKLGKSLGG